MFTDGSQSPQRAGLGSRGRRFLILHWAHVDIDPRVPEIPTPVSLTVIVAVLAVVTVASLIKTRRDPIAKAHAGSLRAHAPKQADAGQDHPAGG